MTLRDVFARLIAGNLPGQADRPMVITTVTRRSRRLQTMRGRTVRPFRIALAAAVLPALLVAGCGGDDSDETLPRVDDTSTSSTSDEPAGDDNGGSGDTNSESETKPAPKPKGAELTRAQQSVYEKAVKDGDEWKKIADRLLARPVVNDRTYYLVERRTEDPYSTQFFNNVRTFKKNGVHYSGELELHWRVPLDVRFGKPYPRVVWKECAGDGTLKVHKRGQIVEQKDQTPFATKVTMRLVNNGTWVPMKSEDAGTCGAAD